MAAAMLPALAMRRRRREVEDREGGWEYGKGGGGARGSRGAAAWNQMTSTGDGGFVAILT